MGVQRELEVTVLSATNLKNAKHGFHAMDPYAVVWIDSNSKAATHVAHGGGTNPTWNCVIRMLCRENLFGKVAKAKLVLEVFDHKSMKLVGTADVLLSDLQSGIVRGPESGGMSEPKRMSLEVRRRRTGSYQKEKVIGTLDIQVRLGKGLPQCVPTLASKVNRIVAYKGAHIEAPGQEFDDAEQDFFSFNVDLPAPIADEKETGEVAGVYYQHRHVEKPKIAWKGIADGPPVLGWGVLALGVGICLF